MSLNFEIIFNLDDSMLCADNTSVMWNKSMILDILDSHNCQYIIAPHVPDENSGFNHLHVGIHTFSHNTYDTIAKWFNLNSNSVQRIKSRFNSTYALYLIHYNQPNKTPVNPGDVVFNFNLDYDKLISSVNSGHRLDDILSGIDNGTIKPYNYTSFMSLTEYTKYKRQIDNAFSYRIDRLRGIDRKMECIFITGDSGVGKTTYAKQIASDRHLHAYISSGSNDILDDYRGEECIILDDLRPQCIALSDLLKMLDNNTASSVKSRFKNKVLECKLIIITTTLPLEQFFSQVFANENETKIQLMRRCGLYITMTREQVNISMFSLKTNSYNLITSFPNRLCLGFSDMYELTHEEKMKRVSEILGSTVNGLTNIRLFVDTQCSEYSDYDF